MDTRSGEYEYEIIAYRPEYRSEILKLQRFVWGPDLERNSAYLDWKYYRNPYCVTGPIIHLALYSGTVVGTRAMFGTSWQAGEPGKVMRGLSCADAVVHPEHRRRGLLRAMTDMLLADLSKSGEYEYDITLSANRASADHNLKSGWRSAGSVGWMARRGPRAEASPFRETVRRLPVFSTTYRRLRSLARRAAGALSPDHSSPFTALDRASTEGHISTTSDIRVGKAPRPSEMASLVQRGSPDGRIRHVRDRRYFEWRYNNPLSKYRFLFCEGDDLEGYLVLQTPTRTGGGGGWVTIVDWETTSMEVWTTLLRAVLELASSSVLTIWSATLPDEAKALLPEYGFGPFELQESQRHAAFQHSLLVRPIGTRQSDGDWTFNDRCLLDMTDWDLRPIYSDGL